MKRTKKIPEQKLEAPSKISRASLATAMRRLKENQDFRLLMGRWLDIRGRVLEEGKAKPSEAAWSVLAGFDLAILEPEKWASLTTADDELKQRAEELQEQLTGNAR